MPEPLPLGRVLGPSVILAGLGVGSGEYIIWPFMTATVGTFFLWAAVLSVTVQYFLNMEIERYTLATGETAVTGFVRFWKPWGALFCLFTIVPNMWPGWATSGVTILGFLVGAHRRAAGDHRRARRLGRRPHRLPHRLSDARARAVLQGRPDAGVSRHRDRRRHQPLGVGRAAEGGHRLRPASALRRDPDRADAERVGVCRRGRRQQPLSEQLDSRQGLRDGHLHPAHRLADHRRRGGCAGHRVDDAAGPGEPAPVQGLVGSRQPGAAGVVLVHLRVLDHRLLDARVLVAWDARAGCWSTDRFRQSPYADLKPPGDDTKTAARKEGAKAPRKLWHSSPGSSGG